MSVPVPPLTAISLAEPDAELLTTICRVCDGEATRADMDRLEQLLADPAAVTLYLAVRELDATLIWKTRWRRPWQPPHLAAAAAGSQSNQPTLADRLESVFDQVATVVGTTLLSLGRWLGSRSAVAPAADPDRRAGPGRRLAGGAGRGAGPPADQDGV